ncbi:MAG: hypothetical protein PHE17_15530 [Thiothrix sp.]|uniref:hypothetical protein n=1 Tax=Thiothrix sp. TaxID=1032 RepID=UPI00260B6772|nr:hypothetical protein [Thiothrix sp.]MDD5394426.1 hypothetical protein [Thiothrix sp.]
MTTPTKAAAAAGMIAGHKLYATRANGAISNSSIPNPYYRSKTIPGAICEMAWSEGLAEGMKLAKDGVTFRKLCKALEVCK